MKKYEFYKFKHFHFYNYFNEHLFHDLISQDVDQNKLWPVIASQVIPLAELFNQWYSFLKKYHESSKVQVHFHILERIWPTNTSQQALEYLSKYPDGDSPIIEDITSNSSLIKAIKGVVKKVQSTFSVNNSVSDANASSVAPSGSTLCCKKLCSTFNDKPAFLCKKSSHNFSDDNSSLSSHNRTSSASKTKTSPKDSFVSFKTTALSASTTKRVSTTRRISKSNTLISPLKTNVFDTTHRSHDITQLQGGPLGSTNVDNYNYSNSNYSNGSYNLKRIPYQYIRHHGCQILLKFSYYASFHFSINECRKLVYQLIDKHYEYHIQYAVLEDNPFHSYKSNLSINELCLSWHKRKL